jgi:hypothetical protein
MAEYHPVAGFPKYLSFFVYRVLETTIWTFAELGIADLLAAAGTPQTADEIAQKQGWNTEILYRVLRSVADADIVREIKSNQTIEPEKSNRFELTEDGRFLTSNHPSKTRDLVCLQSNPLMKNCLNYLPQLVREGYSKGNGLQQVIGGEPVFEYLKRKENQALARNFNGAMTSMSTYNSQPVVNAVDFSRFNTIVDIGGGLGYLLSCILEKYLTIKHGICFDLSNVIEHSKIENELEKRKISKERYEFIAGDMFDAKTIPQADAYIMKSIIHDWNDERAIDIFKSIRTAARGKQVTIFIVELIILPENEQNKSINYVAHTIDIHMLIELGAKERTQEQYEYLLEQSGFKFKQLHKTETPHSVIEAVAN